MPKTIRRVMKCLILKLQTNSEDLVKLDDLCLAFREAYNQYLAHGERLHTANKRKLEPLPVTHRLLGNTRQVARDVACESIRSYYELRETNEQAKFPQQVEKPMSTRLNYRDGYSINKHLIARVSVRKGVLVHAPIIGSPEQLLLIQQTVQKAYRFGAAIVKKHKGAYYLHVTIELAKAPQYDPLKQHVFVGVDVNEKNLALSALTEEGQLLASLVLDFADINGIKQGFFSTRKRLQKAGKLSLVRTIRTKEHDTVGDIYQKVTHLAMLWMEQFSHPVLVLEDLTWIRKQIQMGKKMNRRLHSWAFGELQRQLTYKAYYRGWAVQHINPEYTSQTCPVCTKARRSHKKKRRFQCKTPSCRFTDHRDRVASVNIALKGLAILLNHSNVLTLKKHQFGSHSILVVRRLASGLMKSAKVRLIEFQALLGTGMIGLPQRINAT